MELREIRSFVILAEQLHFGNAARLLHLTQPALSRQIHKLEEELGGELLTRGRHGARLTAMGSAFLTKARVLLADADDLVRSSRLIAQGGAGRLRIGFGFHTLDLVSRALVRLRKVHPLVRVTLRDMSTSEQIDDLLGDKIDMGFIRSSKVPGLEMQQLLTDRLILAVGESMVFPRDFDLSHLRDQPFVFISREKSPTLHRHILDLCSRYGFHPRIVQEVPEITTVLGLVRAGLGVSMIPASFAQNHYNGVRFRTISDSRAVWPVVAVWKKHDRSPLIARFLELLKIEARSTDPRGRP
ncbi:DNA-binding transcriptional regulator, LysR family [Terrimicrobium sacchariphilum]|uniref:DNA-binding transcriptional regulator, LysR family n=1 Tax=Terrimicrobium sacchariphilum TaxID=690879 RepID=A0A146G3J7_TERSA|nr:LysR family transcriptional regulator [Terrimicrobium sacchariphilum]GAT31617.1 DNA-binding transcriptional regulator, LysR family [Terrimicrobium sacchariphilum]